MKNKLKRRIAWRNVVSYKQLLLPFIFTSGIMGMLFFIGASLLDNKFVQERNANMISIMSLAVTLVGIFAVIFITYCNRLISKTRSKEIALYEILGMEKKHINAIMFIEQNICFLAISILSIAGGRIFGKALFLIFNKITGSQGVPLMEYPLTMKPVLLTIAVIGISYLIIAINGIGKIYRSSPIELMSSKHKREGEPKNRYILLVIGALFLGGGYFAALTTKGTLDAITIFFFAAIAVVIGTYLLFISLGSIVLKALRRNKKFYYKAENFLSISGMLHRINSNGLSLGSIALLSTMIILTLTITASAYVQTDRLIDQLVDDDYNVDYFMNESHKDYDNYALFEKELKNKIESTTIGNEEIKGLKVYQYYMNGFTLEKGALKHDYKKNPSMGDIYVVSFMTVRDYNNRAGTNYKLGKNEIIIADAKTDLASAKNLVIATKKYKVIDHAKEGTKETLILQGQAIVVPDEDDLFKIVNYYNKDYNVKSGQTTSDLYHISAAWHVDNMKTDYSQRVKTAFESEGEKFSYETREEKRDFLMQINGGFFFIGMLMGTIFLIGAIMIIYYKQISEAFEDRNRYQIMAKVGLPEKIVKRTTRKQILWLFFLPLAVAVIHCAVASKIVFQLMALFAVTDVWFFVGNLLTVIAVFAAIYLIIFIMTSKVYHRIIS
ncbi:MAG: hypothetical protein PUK14_05105 [Clostridiales bacterium]|nr:hypothetical protein [Clostridiales bacterium]MDY6117499.1 FtsX-like permease family protein [Anaerovoracaceae bacterium]